MSNPEQRSGFRLPWGGGQDRVPAPESVPDDPEPAEASAPASSPEALAWPESDFNARLGITPQQQREAAAEDVSEPQEAAQPAATPQEPPMSEPTPAPAPAPVPFKKPTKLMADLSAAIRATAEAARAAAQAQVDEDVAAVIAGIRDGATEGESALRTRSEDDIAGIREWSKAEIARIKEETEARITARKGALQGELAAHAAAVDGRVGEVEAVVAAYHDAMTAYAGRLAAEDDPARLATMAETMPDAPSLDAWSGLESVDTSAWAQPELEPEAMAQPEMPEPEMPEPEMPEPEMPEPEMPEPESEVSAEPEMPEPEAEVALEESPAQEVETAREPEPEPVTSPWGDPNPWARRDSAEPSEDLPIGGGNPDGDDVPRWAAGETPDGFPEPAEGGDPVDRGAIMAALEAAAEAVVAAEAAAESADQAEAAADVAETAAEILKGRATADDEFDPEAMGAFSARVDAGGFETESFTERLASLLPHEGGDASGPGTTQVVVTGLVSVASIASFKRHLGRIAGVTAVAVASGPEGEFVFNVTHGADVAFRDAIPTLPGFAARVTGIADGVVSVTARDPEAES